MKMRECPACAMKVAANSKTCPICSYEFPDSRTGAKWIAALLLIGLLVSWFLFDLLF
ncbi:MAG: hypothetical protein J0L66_05550 [Cytophagales bacterium]|nr:hypothetical protein [Cytophagales bacterium]